MVIPIKRMQEVRPLQRNKSLKLINQLTLHLIKLFHYSQTPIVTVRELLELLMTIPNLALQSSKSRAGALTDHVVQIMTALIGQCACPDGSISNFDPNQPIPHKSLDNTSPSPSRVILKARPNCPAQTPSNDHVSATLRPHCGSPRRRPTCCRSHLRYLLRPPYAISILFPPLRPMVIVV
jgi:hypothetical protein